MTNSNKPTLDLFGDPDINPLEPSRLKLKDKKEKVNRIALIDEHEQARPLPVKRTAAIKPDKQIQQAYLPGLSRRGRPRSKHPISAVERTAEHRRKRLAEGSKRVEMILSPEVSRQLDAMAEHFKEPRSEVIATLVVKAFARVFKTKPVPADK